MAGDRVILTHPQGDKCPPPTSLDETSGWGTGLWKVNPTLQLCMWPRTKTKHVSRGMPCFTSSQVRPNSSAHCPTTIAHVGPLPRRNTADLSVLRRKQPYVNGLWGQFIFIWRFNLTLISRGKNKDGGIWFMAVIKNNQRCVFISQPLTVSSGFWPTSWRGSSGRWSLRISVYSRMNTASPSLAHVATWKTTILSVACNVDLIKSHFFAFFFT